MPTYTQIGSAVVVGSGGAATMTFTSIPSTYTDLVVKISARSSRSAARDELQVVFNSTASSYSGKNIIGFDTNSVASYDSSPSTYLAGLNISGSSATASTFGSTEIYIPNYAGSTNKSLSVDTVGENNSSTSWIVGLNAGLWSNTAAITSITLSVTSTFSFVQYSTAYLYGVSNA
jgi:hypothetical protein